jgi:hypothetical protein
MARPKREHENDESKRFRRLVEEREAVEARNPAPSPFADLRLPGQLPEGVDPNEAQAQLDIAKTPVGPGSPHNPTAILAARTWLIERGVFPENVFFPNVDMPVLPRGEPPARGKSVPELRDKADKRRSGELKIRLLADVTPREIQWIWRGRLPEGAPVLYSGDKASGKSNLTCAIAAAISRGRTWPFDGEEIEQGSVLMLNSEEDPETVIRPRLERFGADLGRIGLIEGTKPAGGETEYPFSLALDVELLERRIQNRKDVRLLIIDTLSSYLGRIDTSCGADIRSVLEPLFKMAQRQRFGIILCNHLSKSANAKALYRSKDSIDIANVCRMTWVVGKDPDQPHLRFLAPGESNFAPGAAVGFSIGKDGSFDWATERPGLTADALLAREAEVLSQVGKRGPVGADRRPVNQWLTELLQDGEMFLTDIIDEARALGYKRSAIWRGLKRIDAIPSDEEDGRMYRLPDALFDRGEMPDEAPDEN